MFKNTKHKKIMKIIIVFIILFICLETFFSIKYKTPNALLVTNAIAQVMWSDTDYVVVNANPRVIIGKKDFSIRNYQLERNYIRLQTRANGTFLIYSNGEHEEYIEHQKWLNFSTWRWKN